MCVLNADDPRRLPSALDELPLLQGHQGPILDFEPSPFDDHLWATASEDGYVRLFRIPENGLIRRSSSEGLTGQQAGKEPVCSWRQPKKPGLLVQARVSA